MGGVSDPSSPREIGGYFELALPDHGDPFPRPYRKFQSARAALRALLESGNFRQCWVPAYICDSVLDAVRDAGCTPEFYFLDDAFNPKITWPLCSQVVLIYVNYFGLCHEGVASIRQRMPADQLIVDNTQALFAAPVDVFGSIYSPRKFVGVPDGGLLVSSSDDFTMPDHEDTLSSQRMGHLLTRMTVSARAGYAQFQQANQLLEDTAPLRMSRLTARLLHSIDMQDVQCRRRLNFIRLAKAFNDLNAIQWVLDACSVPLCYPLVVDRDVTHARRALADKGIYVPTFWDEARPRIGEDCIERQLLDRCLALPCDQRYGADDMDRVIHEVLDVLFRY
ncbi:hypothetical protein [Castellaniella sp.]|uniref:hypothetical protein n=1 Tax=Castellaniella sp. TaxID=1955812 RepID=UPI0035611D4F